MMFSCVKICNCVDQCGQDPRGGIAKVQYLLGREPGKYGGKPDDPVQTGTGDSHQHGSDRVSKAAHNTHDHFHDTA